MAKKILIIDDEVALAKNLKAALKKEYTINLAFNGKDGLRKAIDKKPDLILLDLILPDGFGLEVIKKLKMRKETRRIPIIALTCLGDTPNVSKVLQAGCQAYLIKSDFSLSEVVKKIKEVIS